MAIVYSGVRPLADIEAEYDAKYAQMSSIIAGAKEQGRDLTEAEAARFDSVDAEIRCLAAEKQKAEQAARAQAHFNSPEFQRNLPENLRSGSAPTAGWQVDSKGRKFAILNKGDKATSLLPTAERAAFGHYVLGRLFGANAATPPGVKMALSGDSNHLGGFLVPESLSGELVDLMRARARLLEAGTRVILMDSDNLTIPKVISDVVPQVKAQNAPFTASNPTFGAVRLQTMTAGCVVTMSRELAEDSRQLLAESIGTLLINSMAVAVDKWGLAGTGSEEPLGLLNRAGIGSTGSVGAIDWTDVAAAATALREINHEPNACILHPTAYDALFNTETGDGTNAARGWLGAPPTLSNVTFLQSTNCPEDKLILGDFSKYVMGLRTSALVEASTQAGDAFVNHQVLVKISMRFDFVPLMEEAFHALEDIS